MSTVDIDMIVTTILRDGLGGPGVGTEIPAVLAASVPFVVVRQIPGGSSQYPQFGQTGGQIQADAFANNRKDARDLARQALDVLNDAWGLNTATDAGSIARIGPFTGPWQMPADYVPAGIYQFVWTASIVCCP